MRTISDLGGMVIDLRKSETAIGCELPQPKQENQTEKEYIKKNYIKKYISEDALKAWVISIIKEAKEKGDDIFGENFEDTSYENLINFLCQMFEVKEN